MQTGRAILKRFGSEMNVPAISAIPEYFFITFENLVLHHILKQFPVSFLMSFFCRRDSLKCVEIFLKPSSSATLANSG